MGMMIQVVCLAIGFLMLVKGADYFVEGAAGIADKFGIPQLVIGLTIVAMGTSAPEAAVSITAALGGNAGITIGNVLGSNVFNVLLILGITACIVATAVADSTIRVELPFMVAITLVLAVLGFTGENVSFWEGVILLVLFLTYLTYLFVMARKNRQETDEEEEKRPLWKLILFAVLGLAVVVWGSDITVDAAVYIAEHLKISQRVIGLTIVAVGTSLPELVTSISAARKGKTDIAIGNIVGSNIFNILFVVGLSSLIIPIGFEAAFIWDTMIAAAAGVLLFFCVIRKKQLTRTGGIILLLAYAAYFIYLM